MGTIAYTRVQSSLMVINIQSHLCYYYYYYYHNDYYTYYYKLCIEQVSLLAQGLSADLWSPTSSPICASIFSS